MNNTRLSVIVPIFNVEKYLKRCLDSIINQTYKDLEIICVNDGSEDNSSRIIEEYSRADLRIKVINKSNGGLVSARKVGIKTATGMYVTYVDSDDWIEPNMYQRMMTCMLEYDPDLVASGFIRDYGSYVLIDNEKKTGYYYGRNYDEEIKNSIADYEHPFKFLISPSMCNKIFKTKTLLSYQMSIPDEVTIDEDTICSYPYIVNANSIYILEDSYYHYCQRSGSMLNSMEKTGKEQAYAVNLAYNYLRNRIDDKLWKYLRLYAMLCVCPDYILDYSDSTLYPFGKIDRKNVVIYGQGGFGKRVNKWISDYTDLNIVALADKNGDGSSILRLEQMKMLDFDYVLVCTLQSEVTKSIILDLQGIGIETKKIRIIKNL